MVARPYVKKTRTNYFGFGKKKRRKRTYFSRGTTVSVSCPYVHKRNRLMLGEGKRKRRRKTVSKQKHGFFTLLLTVLALITADLATNLIR